ncbi:hypothetical protein [Streptomyces sp. NBC_01571]|uniref:hypothetical protein n=1 Tax=unclassified Streptomyces TaxID=2593676 RepID=UPI0022567046|nr:hypothetical protein [Streptomyces sp. NBC_01571]MCX4579879.1 hypothetical protein [Streptomyces sp. NBC_01571]
MTGIVRIWDPANDQRIGKPLTGHGVSVHAMAILDNTWIAVTGDVGTFLAPIENGARVPSPELD